MGEESGSGFGSLFGGALTSGVSSLVSGGIGTLFNGLRLRQQWKFDRKKMNKQQELDKEKMQLQNQYAIDAENRANAYNDPSAQVARAKAAGLNPLADGSAGVGMSASSAPSGGAPSGSVNAGSVSLPSESVYAFAQMRRERELQKKQIEWGDKQNEADLEVKEAEARNLNANAQGTENNNSIFGLTKRIQEANANNAEIQSRIASIDELIRNNDYAKALVELDLLEQQKDINDETKQNLIATRALIKAQTETEGKNKELVEAKTDTEKVNAKYLKALKNHTLTKDARESLELDFENFIHEFRKDHSHFDYWFDKGDKAAVHLEKLVDIYLRDRGLDEQERQNAKKNSRENMMLYGFLLRSAWRFLR